MEDEFQPRWGLGPRPRIEGVKLLRGKLNYAAWAETVEAIISRECQNGHLVLHRDPLTIDPAHPQWQDDNRRALYIVTSLLNRSRPDVDSLYATLACHASTVYEWWVEIRDRFDPGTRALNSISEVTLARKVPVRTTRQKVMKTAIRARMMKTSKLVRAHKRRSCAMLESRVARLKAQEKKLSTAVSKRSSDLQALKKHQRDPERLEFPGSHSAVSSTNTQSGVEQIHANLMGENEEYQAGDEQSAMDVNYVDIPWEVSDPMMQCHQKYTDKARKISEDLDKQIAGKRELLRKLEQQLRDASNELTNIHESSNKAFETMRGLEEHIENLVEDQAELENRVDFLLRTHDDMSSKTRGQEIALRSMSNMQKRLGYQIRGGARNRSRSPNASTHPKSTTNSYRPRLAAHSSTRHRQPLSERQNVSAGYERNEPRLGNYQVIDPAQPYLGGYRVVAVDNRPRLGNHFVSPPPFHETPSLFTTKRE